VREKLMAAEARGMKGQDWSCFTEITRSEAGQ
jgi:hypothetical protein